MSLALRLRQASAELQSIAKHVGKNLVLAIPGASPLRRNLLGSAHWSGAYDADWTARRSRQLRQILDAYRDAWGDWSWLAGKTTLEIGSGPDIAIPFTMCALGAGTAYASDVEPCGTVALPDHAMASYRELASLYVHSNPTGPCSDAILSRVKLAFPVSAEQLEQTFARESIDLVVSTCSLQHVGDPSAAIRQIHTVLRPGGRMIHAVATENHCCGDVQADPLHHLIYPEWLWRAMFSHRVGHNRLRWFEWREIIEASGFVVDHVRIAVQLDRAYIRDARPRLSKRFREMTPEQLEPSYFIVACTKSR